MLSIAKWLCLPNGQGIFSPPKLTAKHKPVGQNPFGQDIIQPIWTGYNSTIWQINLCIFGNYDPTKALMILQVEIWNILVSFWLYEKTMGFKTQQLLLGVIGTDCVDCSDRDSDSMGCQQRLGSVCSMYYNTVQDALLCSMYYKNTMLYGLLSGKAYWNKIYCQWALTHTVQCVNSLSIYVNNLSCFNDLPICANAYWKAHTWCCKKRLHGHAQE